MMPLFIIILAIVQFGFIFNSYVTITNASREGARLGTVYVYNAGLSKAQNDLARNNAIKDSRARIDEPADQGRPQLHDRSTWTQSGLTFTNGDLVVTYANPAAVLDTDARVGPADHGPRALPPGPGHPVDRPAAAEGRQRPPRPRFRDHDGRQLMTDPVARTGAVGPEGARGQVLVIFALSLVAIMAAAGLAFDIGRFYSERRFLQNAADAGALAIANALIRGESATDAEAEGRDVLARNLAGSPTGTSGSVATTPEYASRPRRRPAST